MNYLPVSVYSNKEFDDCDCTLGGVTVVYRDKLVVPCETGHLTEEDINSWEYIVLEPMEPAFQGCPVRFKARGETRWAMAGGNFVYTTDSRFSETYGPAPVSVHDRIEG